MSGPTWKKAKSVREILVDFCGYTNIHGLGRIVASKSLVAKLFWAILCLAAYGMCGFQCYNLITEYLERPTVTVLSIAHETKLKFPAVTICNLNIVRKSKLPYSLKEKIANIQQHINANDNDFEEGSGILQGDEENQMRKRRDVEKVKEESQNNFDIENGENEYTYEGDYNGEEEQEEEWEIGVKDKTEAIYTAVVDELAASPLDELAKMGHQLEDLVQSCTFKGYSCSNFTGKKYNSYWVRHWNSRYGNCYTFNSGSDKFGIPVPVVASKKSGLQHGLKLNLKIEQEEYITELSHAAGVKVVIHPQGQMPFPNEEGYFASPGHSTAIGITKQSIERVDRFNNESCTTNKRLSKENFYRRFENTSVYTNKVCTKHCQGEHQLKACNCTSIDFPFPGFIPCRISNPREFACFRKVNRDYIERRLGCEDRCPIPCRENVFVASTSVSEWPSAVYESKFNDTYIQLDGKYDLSKISVSRNYLQVRVYFEQLNYQKVTEKFAYSEESLAANIGGTLGLWIGVSALAGAEVLELIILIFGSCFKRLNRNSEKGKTDEEIDMKENIEE